MEIDFKRFQKKRKVIKNENGFQVEVPFEISFKELIPVFYQSCRIVSSEEPEVSLQILHDRIGMVENKSTSSIYALDSDDETLIELKKNEKFLAKINLNKDNESKLTSETTMVIALGFFTHSDHYEKEIKIILDLKGRKVKDVSLVNKGYLGIINISAITFFMFCLFLISQKEKFILYPMFDYLKIVGDKPIVKVESLFFILSLFITVYFGVNFSMIKNIVKSFDNTTSFICFPEYFIPARKYHFINNKGFLISLAFLFCIFLFPLSYSLPVKITIQGKCSDCAIYLLENNKIKEIPVSEDQNVVIYSAFLSEIYLNVSGISKNNNIGIQDMAFNFGSIKTENSLFNRLKYSVLGLGLDLNRIDYYDFEGLKRIDLESFETLPSDSVKYFTKFISYYKKFGLNEKYYVDGNTIKESERILGKEILDNLKELSFIAKNYNYDALSGESVNSDSVLFINNEIYNNLLNSFKSNIFIDERTSFKEFTNNGINNPNWDLPFIKSFQDNCFREIEEKFLEQSTFKINVQFLAILGYYLKEDNLFEYLSFVSDELAKLISGQIEGKDYRQFNGQLESYISLIFYLNHLHFEKRGVLHMQSIKNISDILNKKGKNNYINFLKFVIHYNFPISEFSLLESENIKDILKGTDNRDLVEIKNTLKGPRKEEYDNYLSRFI